MNILYLNTTFQCGGAEKVTSQIFQGMRARGHEVYQIVSYDTRHSMFSMIRSSCVCSTG